MTQLHTWGEFKRQVERQGVRDDDVIERLANQPVNEPDEFRAMRDDGTGHVTIDAVPPDAYFEHWGEESEEASS